MEPSFGDPGGAATRVALPAARGWQRLDERLRGMSGGRAPSVPGGPAGLRGRPISGGGFGTSPGAVDVVAWWLDAEPAVVDELARSLSPDERARARRFRATRPRDAYIVGRGRLRELLGLVVGCPPAAVRLVGGPGGKPRLAGAVGERVRFNVAHSSALMLCAVAVARDVGVDVERVDESADWEDIAARSFAAAERRALAVLPGARQRAAFFACWTRKEAVIKATGEGLGRPLDSFVVSVAPDRAEMLSCAPALGAPDSWFLAPVPVPSSYCAAVAVRDGGGAVSLRLWSR
ncbi:MAG TPA: 4'-phosphopantetheinyl transferase superfamily protein [Methylomirabilota bacterium]